MRILIMAQHYAPEEVSGAALATELAEDLVNRGHSVSFVTSAPNYPYGKVFSGYQNKLFSKETRNGVKIIRVWSFISPARSFWKRMANFGSFSAMALFGGLLAEKSDVIFCYSPPLPLGLSAWLLSLYKRVPWILRIEDLYPDAAVATGVIKNRRGIAFLKLIERFLYRKADHISVISEGFRRNLLDKGVPDNKLSVAPVWADPDVIRPMTRDIKFRQKNNLQGKFVVLYAGNLGITSALEDVIEAAKMLQDNREIVFLIVGEGVKKEKLMSQAQGLKQVNFLPYQPRSELSELMVTADVGVVTLNPDSAAYSLPSKVFSIMSSERPVIAVTPSNSEVARLLGFCDCGIHVPFQRPSDMAECILELKQDPALANRLGKNGRRNLESRFSRNACVELFEKHLQRVVQ
jgi:colanic acid biosynthesis glycosyl transferase WcaI